MNKLDPFEELLRSKLQNHRIEFNEDSWISIEEKLPKRNKSNNIYWILGAAALLSISIIFLINNSNYKEKDNIDIIQKNIIEKNRNNLNQLDKKNNSINSLIKKPISNENLKSNYKQQKNENSIKATTNKLIDKEKLSDEKLKEDSVRIVNNDESTQEKETNNNHTKITTEKTNNNTTDYTEEQKIPDADFTCNKNEICTNEEISFKTISSQNFEYYWDFDDGTSSTTNNPSHVFSGAGKYHVTLKISSKNNPSANSKSDAYLITVKENPNANFTTETIEESGILTTYFKYNSNYSSVNLNWDFDDGSKSDLENPSHKYKNKGSYIVKLTVKDNNNCKSSSTNKVYIDRSFNLLAPNSFTPNGDGINDYFIPESLKIMSVDFVMTIYNKRGIKVYETKNINQPWDGFDQNTAQRCSAGSYVWVVTLINEKGETELYKDALLLLE